MSTVDPVSILFVAKQVGRGGMTLFLRDNAEHLARAGHRIAIHTLPGPGIESIRADLEAAGVELDLTPRLSLPGLRAAAQRHSPRALSLLTGTFPPNTTINRMLLRLDLPIIESIHAMAVSRIGLARRLFFRSTLARAQNYRAAFLSGPMFDACCAALPSLAHRFVRLPFGMRIPNAGTIPHPDPKVRLITITRLLEVHKDTTTLLRALALLNGRTTAWAMTIIGDGRDADALRALAADLGLDRQVTFAGRAADPIAPLRASDIFILSTRSESFGRVNVEAAAVGLPVIASDVLGCRESVARDVNGILVAPGDPSALAAAIGRLIEDPTLRARLAAEGPRHARRFAPEPHCEAFLSLIDGLR